MNWNIVCHEKGRDEIKLAGRTRQSAFEIARNTNKYFKTAGKWYKQCWAEPEDYKEYFGHHPDMELMLSRLKQRGEL